MEWVIGIDWNPQADESLASLRHGGPAASAPVRQGPLSGSGLNAGHIDGIACLQIEKVDQIDLMSRNRARPCDETPTVCAQRCIGHF